MAKKEQKETTKNKKSFFKGFKAELKKVSWPTPKQLVNNTVAVITIVLLTAVIVFVLDLVFETINSQGIDRLKQMVSNTTAENNTTAEGEVTENETSTETTNEVSTENTETTENADVETESANTTEATSENTTPNE